MFSDTGVESLLALLRGRFGNAGGTSSKVAFDGLRSCTRGSTTMEEYLVAFDEAIALCEEAGCSLSDAMQVHVVVDQANLSSPEQTMALSTASTGTDAPVTYVSITRALLLLYGGRSKTTAVALVAQPSSGRQPRPPRKQPGGGGAPGGGGTADGACWYCQKPGHSKKECRMRVKHLRERGITIADAGGGDRHDEPPADAVIHMVVLTGTTGSSWAVPVGEVIVDSGATATVVGEDWLTEFLLELPVADLCRVTRTTVSAQLKFGDGEHVPATGQVVLPVRMGGRTELVRAYTLPGGLPLLISRPTLTSLKASIDYEHHTLRIPTHRSPIKLRLSSVGHHTLNALGSAPAADRVALIASAESPPSVATARTVVPDDESTEAEAPPATAGGGVVPAAGGRRRGGRDTAHPSPPPLLTKDTPDLAGIGRKLHVQYSHASPSKISELLRWGGTRDAEVFAAVRDAAAACTACHVHRAAPNHAVVTIPSATAFNEALAADLLFLSAGRPVLHVIDMYSRYSKCTLLPNQTAVAVGDALLSWIVSFGAPLRLLSDGGGEFDSDLTRLVADRFGIFLDQTSAQAPWSNGMCERHNAVLKHTYTKLQADEPTAPSQLLLDMACLAKNSLLVHGAATPHQLLCGSQPRLPSALTDAPPALSEVRELGDSNLQQTLRLLGASRVAFMRAEADQSLRRALQRKTRSPGITSWARDAAVYYWNASVSAALRGYRGPARVGGQVGRQVLLRHGGKWITRDAGCVIPVNPAAAAVLPGAAPPADPTLARLPTPGHAVDDTNEAGADPPDDEDAGVESSSMDMWAKLAQALADIGPAPATPPSPVGGAPVAEVAPPAPAPAVASDEAPLRRSSRAAAPVVRFAAGTAPEVAPRAAASPPAAGLALLAHPSGSRSAARSAARFAARPTPPPEPPDAQLAATLEFDMDALHATAAEWVFKGYRVPAPSPAPPRTGVPVAWRPASLHASLLLTAYAGAEDISSVLRVSEHPSAPVAQVYISRSEIRRRQEVPVALAGRRFDAPMRSELDAWHAQGVYVEVPDEGQIAISMRWVLTEKPAELPEDPAKLKARLVVRGCEDRHKASVVSTSPTVGRATLRVVFALMTDHGWVPRSVDVRTAFLQGLPLDRVKPVYVRPPPQAHVPDGLLWELRKCAYGLTDAPRRWYEAVVALLLSLGYVRCEVDHGLFFLFVGGRLLFVIATHVDDFLYGGAATEVTRFETALRKSFDVGPVTVGTLTFTGLRVVTDADPSSGSLTIKVDQDHYLATIDAVPVSAARLSTNAAAVSSVELTQYRRAVGALLWASGQTQPYLACASSLLARRFHQAVVKDLVDVNRSIGAAQAACGLPLLYQHVGAPYRLVLFTDASSITLQSATAQTGYLLFLSKDGARGALHPDTALTLLAWGSHRQRRVTHSSFAAETYALLDGMRAAIETACVLAHLTDGTDASLLPVDAFTDCHGLFNTMSGTGLSRPKEINAAIAALRDMYSSAAMSSLTWLPAAGQVADCLTKPSSSASLRAVLRSGRYGLRPVGALTKTHETDRTDLDAALLPSSVDEAASSASPPRLSMHC